MITTSDRLMQEVHLTLLDIKVLTARLDRIQVSEVMEEDLDEVALRQGMEGLVEAVAALVDHDMLGGFENVIMALKRLKGGTGNGAGS